MTEGGRPPSPRAVRLLDHDRKSLKVIAVKVFIGLAKYIEPTALMQSAGGLPSKRLKNS